MSPISDDALLLLAKLLEDSEHTISLCDDTELWANRGPLVEELWKLYESQLNNRPR